MIFLGLGALMVLSTFWNDIIKMLPKANQPQDKVPAPSQIQEVQVSKPDPSPAPCSDGSLCELVTHWEDLKRECEQRGLKRAASEVAKIFPLLVEKDKPTPAPAPAPEGDKNE